MFVFENIALRIRQGFKIKISYVDTERLDKGLALEAADAVVPSPTNKVQHHYRTALRLAFVTDSSILTSG